MLCDLSAVWSVSVSRSVHYERFYCNCGYRDDKSTESRLGISTSPIPVFSEK